MSARTWRTGDRCGLLVSVRDVDEAREAVAGGATVVDVKEPREGPLGAASPAVTAAIAEAVGGMVPWTMACGECVMGAGAIREHVSRVLDALESAPPPTAVKAGLADAGPDWRRMFRSFVEAVPDGIEPIAAAYGDWASAAAPDPGAVIRAAADCGCRTVLIDTFGKEGGGLVETCGIESVEGWIAAAREAGMGVAVAGGLTMATLPAVRNLGPDLVAVRSAACVGGRQGRVCGRRVRRLCTL